MDALFGLLGLLGIIVGIVMIIFYLITKKPKKPALIILGVSFIFFVIGLSLPSSSPSSESVVNNKSAELNQETILESSQQDSSEKDTMFEKDEEGTPVAFREIIEKIEVTYEIQDIYEKKRKVVIWVYNNSDKILSGNLRIDIKSCEDHILAIDSFPIDDFKPGQRKYSVIMADTTYPVDKVLHTWTAVEFTEPSIKETEKMIDNAATEEVMDDMYMNFGGAGNPEYKTSWYDYIEKIEVYNDGENKWAEVILNTNDPNISDRIGRTVLSLQEHISMVQVFDESHNKICEIYK